MSGKPPSAAAAGLRQVQVVLADVLDRGLVVKGDAASTRLPRCRIEGLGGKQGSLRASQARSAGPAALAQRG
ncbi:MAG: hypothetical protein F4105_03350 [Gemmatimonadetes bacterium]|nr:hypothetical protein [Gemmatimonadota bacterium]